MGMAVAVRKFTNRSSLFSYCHSDRIRKAVGTSKLNISSSPGSTQVLTTQKPNVHRQNCNTRKPKPESSLPSSEVINELHDRGIRRTEKAEIQTTHNPAKRPRNFIDEDDKLSPTKVLHAATITSKYADIILKAKRHMELVNTVKDAAVDPIKAPKIKIDDDLNKTMMKARLMGLRRIDEERVKSNVQRQREAARTAMQQIKQTVFFDNGLEIESAFHALIAG